MEIKILKALLISGTISMYLLFLLLFRKITKGYYKTRDVDNYSYYYNDKEYRNGFKKYLLIVILNLFIGIFCNYLYVVVEL